MMVQSATSRPNSNFFSIHPSTFSISLSVRLDLELTEEGVLLSGILESTVAKVGGGVDELEGDLLGVGTRSVSSESFSEGDDSLDGTNARALDHDKVVLDNTVSNETTHRGDVLLGKVKLSRARRTRSTVGDTVDLVVHRSTRVVTSLTGTSHGEHDVRRMPSTDTGDLSETSVGLPGETGSTPSGGNTLVTVTLADTDDVNALVLLEDGADVDGLFEVRPGEVNLVGDGTTVDLDFHKVGLLLLETSLGDLGVGEDSDNSAVLLDSLKLSGNGSAGVLRVLLGVSGEGLLLGSVPVLVESPLNLVTEVLSPNSGQRPQASRSLDITNSTDNDHRGGLNDGNGLNNLPLVHLGSGSVEVTDNVSHTGLVTHDGGEVDGLLGVVLGERLASTPVTGGTLPGKEGKGTVSRLFVLPVRHV